MNSAKQNSSTCKATERYKDSSQGLPLVIARKVALVLLGIIFCFSSCKDNKDTTAPSANGQYAVYTMSFVENNDDKGIAVVILLQTGQQLSIDNFVFRYAEHNEQKVINFATEFAQHIVTQDSVLKSYPTLGEYTKRYFSTRPSFKSSGTIANEQLYKMVNNGSFSLARNAPIVDKSMMVALLEAIVPTAQAQNPSSLATGLLLNYASVIGGIIVGTGVAIATSGALIPTLVIGGAFIAGNIAIDRLTGTNFGISPITPTSPSMVFGIGKLTNINNSIATPIITALSGNNYTPPNPYPESGKDIFTMVKSNIADLLQGQSGSYVLSVTTDDATNISSNSVDVGGKTMAGDPSFSQYIRGVSYSISPNPSYYSSKTATATNGIGGFTTSITDLIPNTVYYYRAFTTYTYGPDNAISSPCEGEVKSFTTGSGSLPNTSSGISWMEDGVNVTGTASGVPFFEQAASVSILGSNGSNLALYFPTRVGAFPVSPNATVSNGAAIITYDGSATTGSLTVTNWVFNPGSNTNVTGTFAFTTARSPHKVITNGRFNINRF